jgi:hypothetical protein
MESGLSMPHRDPGTLSSPSRCGNLEIVMTLGRAASVFIDHTTAPNITLVECRVEAPAHVRGRFGRIQPVVTHLFASLLDYRVLIEPHGAALMLMLFRSRNRILEYARHGRASPPFASSTAPLTAEA